jgi:hypothetical protein
MALSVHAIANSRRASFLHNFRSKTFYDTNIFLVLFTAAGRNVPTQQNITWADYFEGEGAGVRQAMERFRPAVAEVGARRILGDPRTTGNPGLPVRGANPSTPTGGQRNVPVRGANPSASSGPQRERTKQQSADNDTFQSWWQEAQAMEQARMNLFKERAAAADKEAAARAAQAAARAKAQDEKYERQVQFDEDILELQKQHAALQTRQVAFNENSERQRQQTLEHFAAQNLRVLEMQLKQLEKATDTFARLVDSDKRHGSAAQHAQHDTPDFDEVSAGDSPLQYHNRHRSSEFYEVEQVPAPASRKRQAPLRHHEQ